MWKIRAWARYYDGMSSRVISIVLALLAVASAPRLSADSAASYVLDSHILGISEYTAVEATMIIHGSRGDQTRRLEVLMHRPGEDESRVLARIVWPAFLTNMKFLIHNNGDRGQEKWMTTSRGVRRLSDSNTDESVFNSDFTVEDFSDLRTGEYRFAYHEDDDPNGIRVIHARRTEAASGSKVFHVDPEAKLIRRIDYLDPSGALVRQYRILSTQQVASHDYPKQAEMRDLQAGTSTEITIESVDVESRIPARMFNRASL